MSGKISIRIVPSALRLTMSDCGGEDLSLGLRHITVDHTAHALAGLGKYHDFVC